MQNAYMKNKAALTFLSNYDHTDIAVIRMSNSSRMVWGISQPDRNYLIADLQSSKYYEAGCLASKIKWLVMLTKADNSDGRVSLQLFYLP